MHALLLEKIWIMKKKHLLYSIFFIYLFLDNFHLLKHLFMHAFILEKS